MVEGTPARLLSINAVGLKRANFKPIVRAAIKKAFRIISQPGLNTSQSVEKIRSEIEMHEEINHLLDFIKNSTRGVTK
jgi:UDP-N-acetylglucosamine acyltransferase